MARIRPLMLPPLRSPVSYTLHTILKKYAHIYSINVSPLNCLKLCTACKMKRKLRKSIVGVSCLARAIT